MSRPSAHEHGRQPHRPLRAYSLLELVMVLATAVLIASMAMPRFANAAGRYRADFTAQRIANDLTLARSVAKTTSATVTVTFAKANGAFTGTYTMAGVTDLRNRGTTTTVNLTADPFRASVTSASFNSTNQVSFDAYGSPSPSTGGTVVILCAGNSRTITLDGTTGKATWQ